MAGARAHRACRTDDVLTSVFSRLALRDGCVSVASVCKQWRDAWRRRAKGLYRPLRLGVGSFHYGDHLTALAGGGVIVPDYQLGVIHGYTAEGELRGAAESRLLKYASAVALDDEGVSWVVLHDHFALARRRIDYEAMEYHIQASPPDIDFHRPMDVAASGNAVLLLSHDVHWRYGEVIVLDRGTGDVRYRFGSSAPGGVDELRGPSGLAVDGDFCFVADTYNQSVVVFNWRDGTFVRRFGKAGDAPEFGEDDGEHYWEDDAYDDDRKSAEPGQFNEPFAVVVRNKLLYVSEKGGCRIQVLRLPDDISGGDPDALQIIPSPGGVELAGLCLDGDRLWCIGPPIPGSEPGARAELSIFAPIV